MESPQVNPTQGNNGGCGRTAGIGCLVLLCLPGILFVISIAGIVFGALGLGFLGAGIGMLGAGQYINMLNDFPPLGALGLDFASMVWAVIWTVIAVVLLLALLVYIVVYYMRHSAMPKKSVWITWLIVALLCLTGSGVYCHRSVAGVDMRQIRQQGEQLEQLLEQYPDTVEKWLNEQMSEGHSYYYEYGRDSEGNEYEYEERN